MKVGIVMPTMAGRDLVTDVCLAALENTLPHGFEFDVVLPENYPSVGAAWNAGRADVDGEYLLFTIDDAEMHHGWLDVAVETADAGYIPAARQVWPDGTVEGCGSLGFGRFLPECPDWTPCRSTGVIFMRAAWWDKVGEFLPIHYGVDDDWNWRADLHGIRCVFRTGYTFTHHHNETPETQPAREAAGTHVRAYIDHAATLTLPSTFRRAPC